MCVFVCGGRDVCEEGGICVRREVCMCRGRGVSMCLEV